MMADVQELIEQMQAAGEWPSPDILEAIVAHGEAAIDPLREIVRAGAKHPAETEYVDLAVGLLGDLKATSSVSDLLQLFRTGDENSLEWAKDALRSIGHVPLAEVEEIIRDETLDVFHRAMAIHVYEGVADEDEAACRSLVSLLCELLHGFIRKGRKKLTDDDINLPDSIVMVLSHLAAPEARPVIDAAFAAGIVDQSTIAREDVEEDYRQGRQQEDRQDLGTFLEHYRKRYHYEMKERTGTKERAGRELERARLERERSQRADPSSASSSGPVRVPEDAHRPAQDAPRIVSPPAVTHPKVGRNAPCPCGSGRKFKKCCLGKTAEPASKALGPSPRPPEWQVEVQLPPPKTPKPGTIELHPDVPRDLRRRLEQARLESIALLRTMDRAMVYLSEDEFSPELRAVFELEADCAEALWGLDQPLGAFSVSKMLRDTLASLERLPAARSAALSVLEPEDLHNVMKIKDVVVRTVRPEECYNQVKGRDPDVRR